ncbi:DUF1107 domain-containing protein [Vibrio rumoiensis]|uniref:DUF1107 domain-containing protein n=1 Tax=Vibrio rumoiensis 1S-45 TaxID=1188252 RepID=A0A1E5E4K2_9VIBR|nr:DUF1107 domain-containing protein [Vibrio rumoiensis]OEF27773.1 hypothetical protein A1QC_14490 [Vibrio rumoiensis 1S-45]
MRLFNKYVPGQIAKHISRFFKGRIYINGVGKFEFDNAKLIIPSEAENKHYQTVKEINQEVSRIRCIAA